MTHTEWIVSVDDDDKDFDEYFVGNIRDGEMLTRCKDCQYFQPHKGRYQTWRIVNSDGICKYHNYEMTRADDYCSRAERKEE